MAQLLKCNWLLPGAVYTSYPCPRYTAVYARTNWRHEKMSLSCPWGRLTRGKALAVSPLNCRLLSPLVALPSEPTVTSTLPTMCALRVFPFVGGNKQGSEECLPSLPARPNNYGKWCGHRRKRTSQRTTGSSSLEGRAESDRHRACQSSLAFLENSD